jgi:hypothetical protein
MSNGIAHNNLNDISKIYLDTISDINKKEQEDDVKRWQQEDAKYGYDKEGRSLNPKDIKSPFKKKKVKACKEAFSNWRTDLREVTSDAEATEIDNQPEIKEKKVKNKIKINPEFKEAVKQMGGELLEVKEVDSPDGEVKDDKKKEQDDAAAKKISDKERKLKMRILRVKMMATKQDAGASIVAGYEPDIDGAVEYFYEEGINEDGIEQLVEEIGLDEFVNFIEGGTVELNEERAARKASVRAKKYDVVKKEVDAADAARKKSKKGEYSSAYKKKETDVTVYDNKVSKKKTVKKTVKKTETVKKPVTKKVVKAVAKVKKSQPAKKASKPGIRQKIATLYKRGVERHKKAREAGRVPEKRAKEFASGVKSGVKTAVKFAKDVKKVVSKEELEMQEKVLDKFETGEKERIVKGMKKDSKGLKKRYGDKWKNVMYATATKKAKEAGDTSKSDKRYAHEGYQRDPEQSKKDRTHSKQPDPSKDGFTGIGNMSIKDIMKMNAKIKAKEAAKKKKVKEELVIDERTLSSYIPSDRQGEASAANREYVKAQLKKKEDESTKNRGNLSKRDAGKMARNRLHTKKIMSMGEEKKKGLDGKACWKGYRLAGTKKKGGKTVDNCVKEDKALAMVKAAIIKKHGKGAIYDPKKKQSPEDKAKVAAERKKRQDADNKAYAGRAKKAGFKSTQDYTNVVARYGSEDNYKKGKGLGT